jgi:steroid 5-alpha reductase family enzyme
MNTQNYYLYLALILFGYMNFWFIVSLIKKRNDVADVAWGLGFVLLAWSSFYLWMEKSGLALLVNFLVSIWGIRLALHISQRHVGKPEDYRYLKWRQEWGKWFYLRSYFQVYILQGIFLFLIALPVLVINNSPNLINIFTISGIAVWLIGFYFEVVGDYQLSQFIKDPNNKGKLMMSGLWAYSRHPNYFGEVAQWWGIFLIALPLNYGWVSIIGPITITFLILKVSGVPMLEKKMEQNPAFAEYKNRTSMFFPLPTKK